MLKLSDWSFWEKELYLNNLNFIIIGAGIVGYNTALQLRKKHPNSKILILERGVLPTGASTKNAGFTCFGSPSEIQSDIKKLGLTEVENLIEKRWKGLELLTKTVGTDLIDYQNNGSYEIFKTSEKSLFKESLDQLDYLNKIVSQAIGKKNTFSKINTNLFGFDNICGIIKNQYEGQINTGKMMNRYHQLAISKNIHVLFGVNLMDWHDDVKNVTLDTNIGSIKTERLLIATNGFSKSLFSNINLKPARAQVLITEPLDKIPFKGAFHYNEGFYYFRNIGNRILLGGGRNLDIEGETTTEFSTTPLIIDTLKLLLKEVIIPGKKYKIEQTWSGIMGVGESKTPIVKKHSENVFVGIRLGGMGVAIGSIIGKDLAKISST